MDQQFNYRVVIDLSFTSKQFVETTQIFDEFKGDKKQVVVPASATKSTSHDYRQSRIEVFTFEMAEASTSATPGPLKSKYLGDGVVRLFRDDGGDHHHATAQPEEQVIKNQDNTMVAVLAVPSYFSPTDIMGFVGAKIQEQVSHFRMVRTSTANRYMVLIKFRSEEFAQRFIDDYNGKLFNSMEAETCQVVPIKSVQFQTHHVVRSDHVDDDIPYLVEDSFTTTTTTTTTSAASSTTTRVTNTLRPEPPPPPSSLKELPTCPVCLERMDTTVTGLLTILCQHTFHCQCLSKWGDGSCPVCRYTQQGKAAEPATCSVCKSSANPWICLVCGHLGCGRYDSAHAFDHYKESGHCYSMDVNTQRVWDYSSDAYVHRLIQNPDGKLVETSSSEDSSKKAEEEIAIQYTHLLTSQLDSQRSYYEDMLTNAMDRAAEATQKADHAEREMAQMQQKMAQVQLQDEQLSVSESKHKVDYQNAKKRADDLHSLYSKLAKSFKDEKEMCAKMVNKLDVVSREKDELAKQVEDLQGQVKDLMFYLDSVQKLENAGEDVREGTVVMQGSSSSKKNKKKKR